MDDSNIPEIEIEVEAVEPEDANIGRVLNNYTLTRKVGEGGMGDVYLGIQKNLNREVAIKLLKPNENNPEGEHYFKREVQAINMLRHPNIVGILDYGDDADGTLFLVMEFLPGKTLKRVIKKEHPLQAARICNICIQILSALEAAHEKEIVHCDLKPANVMLERVAGQEDYVKVLDFGIAKVKTGANEVGPYTQAGNIVGTFDYMSPEQIMRKDLDGRADLWSLGVIMYEMLTRKRVFHDKDAVSIIGRVMQMPIVPPIEVLGEDAVPPGLNAIVMKAMERNVAKRFQSAAEMRDALKRLLAALEAGHIQANPVDASSLGIDDSGSHSGSLAGSGLVRGSHTGIQSNTGRTGRTGRTGMTSATGISPMVSRSGGFGSAASTVESARLATGIAQGTSVLDQTFSIDALQDSLTGERRKVAVLCIQQRSRGKRGMDPEEMARRSRREAGIIKEVVEHHEGEIDSFLGGTFTVLFGARRARVGDNVRAIECAVALQERFRLMEHGYEHIGLGLTYGEVFLSSRQGGNAFGDTIDRAVEIARSSSESKVLVAEDLMALTRQRVDFDLPWMIGGEQVAEALSVSTEARAAQAEVEDIKDVDVYVPRPMYYDELVRRAGSAREGQGGGVALIGEMGVGKSTLIQHFVKAQRDSGWRVFHAEKAQLASEPNFAPVRVWIRQIASTYSNAKELVRRACGAIGLQRKVEAVVSLYLDDEENAPPPSEMPWGADQSAYAYFTAALFHRMVRFAMRGGPVLLVCDELDPADQQCLALIQSFLESSQQSKLLMLTEHRVDVTRQHGLPEGLEVLVIEGLEQTESRQYVAQLLGYTPPLGVIAQLHERASGNPMFLKEILRALVRRGGAQALTEQGIASSGIPLDLQELLAQRIDELDDNLRNLLAIASVLGESFLEEFFYQITPAHLAPQLGLKNLVALTLLEAREDMFGRIQVGFNPRALRSVVYERIPKSARRDIHASVIEFLETAPQHAAVDDIDLPLMLAFHYRSVDGHTGSAHYLGRAGAMFLDMYDYVGAIGHLQEALELLNGRVAPNDDAMIAPTVHLLTALRESGRIEEAQGYINRLPPIEDISPQFHPELLLQIGLIEMEGGSIEKSTFALHRVVELARHHRNIKLEVKGLLALAQLFDKENQLQRSVNLLVEVSQKVEQIGDLDLSDPDDRRLYWTAYNQLGTLALRQKDIQNAQQYLQAAAQRAQTIQDHRGMVRVISNIGALFLNVRDVPTSLRYFEQALELAKATGDMLNQARILTNMGIASFEGNQYEKCKGFYRQARSIAEEIGWYEGLAELSLRIKQLRQALGR